MAPERTNGNTTNGNYLRNVPNINVTTASIPNGPSSTTPYHFHQSEQNPPPPPPPPVPPRQPVQNYSGYSSAYGPNYYGGFGHGSNQYRGFGGFGGSGGGYSSYGPYMNYNNYGSWSAHSGMPENRFLHYVEANARPTFQSIETVLHAFSSMTMLLESTYLALTNSFRAILSVADSVGKLRSTISQLFSTFAMIRFAKWLYRKIVRTAGAAGLGGFDSQEEESWDESLAKIGNGNGNNCSFWSSLLMFSVFFAIPYAIHKIVSSIKTAEGRAGGSSVTDPKTWYESEEPAHVAAVLYDFVPVNSDELGVKAGQKICIAPKSLQPRQMPGWCRATDNVNVGLVPCNHIKILGQLKKVKKSDDGMTNRSPAARDENKSSTNENIGFNRQKHGKYQNGKTDPEAAEGVDDDRFDRAFEDAR